jgi:ParB family transcriptional regulator, chromosome partitioning protein
MRERSRGLSRCTTGGHDHRMRMLWSKKKAGQLDLLDAIAEEPVPALSQDDGQQMRSAGLVASTTQVPAAEPDDGLPLVVCIDRLDEDPNNPRTEFPESQIDELADDIRERGILEPIVVHPADAHGRYRIHFGAKRLRAAGRAGLAEVPVVVRDAPADLYAQVAENQKRHGLTSLDLARFIRARVDEGESNATISKRLVMESTTVAHHLALLDLPPALDDALKSGRCTSPRTLYELGKLHRARPEQVKSLIAGESEITRVAVAAVRAEHAPVAADIQQKRGAASLLVQANSQCARLEQTLTRIKQVEQQLAAADLDALRQRVSTLMNRLA